MKESIIKVRGMSCTGCESRIQKVLKDVSGVEKVIADHNKGIVKISTRDYVDLKTIKEKIEDIGYDVDD